jgi:hypothetical protein
VFLEAFNSFKRFYIINTWISKEDKVIYCFIRKYLNLEATASQRGESYYSIMKEITNGQLTFKKSVKYLVIKVRSVLRDFTLDKDRS